MFFSCKGLLTSVGSKFIDWKLISDLTASSSEPKLEIPSKQRNGTQVKLVFRGCDSQELR